MSDKARERAVIDVREFVREKTGFKPGDVAVTCPVCIPLVKVEGKFCTGCGREVTALCHENLQAGLQQGSIPHDDLLEGMSLIPGFNLGTEFAEKAFREKRDRALIFED